MLLAAIGFAEYSRDPMRSSSGGEGFKRGFVRSATEVMMGDWAPGRDQATVVASELMDHAVMAGVDM